MTYLLILKERLANCVHIAYSSCFQLGWQDSFTFKVEHISLNFLRFISNIKIGDSRFKVPDGRNTEMGEIIESTLIWNYNYTQ